MSNDKHKSHSLSPDTYKITTERESIDLQQRMEGRSYSEGGGAKKVDAKVSLGGQI